MLFRPSAEQNLEAIHVMLDSWNAEADRFRHAARAARKGDTPTSLVVSSAGEAYDELLSLLGQLDAALDRAPPGSPNFASLLQAQTTAVALLESVGNSYDILETVATETMVGPTRIVHEFAVAAE
jgi:hypothetical protein